MDNEHEARIRKQLRAAGVSAYGMRKFAIRYLPKLIHKDEHIGGIIYGRYRDETGSITLNAGLLVATNKRIVFLDHKPGYTHSDDIAYDSVSGVEHTSAIFSSVKLHTRMKDYSLRFVSPKCAKIFIHYIEDRRLENNRTGR